MKGRRGLTGAFILIGLAHAGGAQLPTVAAGTRVRVRVDSSANSIAGTVVRLSPDTMYVDDGSGSVYSMHRIARRSLVKLEVSVAQQGHAAEGLLLGTLIGAGTGFLFTSLGKDDSYDNFGEAVGDAVVGASAVLIGGLIGAIGGAIAGAGHKTDKWQAVDPASAAPQFSMRPLARGRTGVGLSFSFGGAKSR